MANHEIIDTIPGLINPREITRGLSSAKTYLAHIYLGRGRPVPVVIKVGLGIGKQEQNGWNLLNGHIPLVELVDSGDDFFVSRYRAGRDLHDAVKDRKFLSDDVLEEFTKAHIKLWERTMRSLDKPEELSGYGEKREQTIDLLKRQMLVDISGRHETISHLLNFEFIINGKPIGKIEEVISKMDRTMSEVQNVSAVHGDENFKNVRVKINHQWFMFDLNTASFRSPYESIAKILMWLDASTSKLESHQVSISLDQKKVFMNVKSKLSPDIIKSINLVRSRLTPFLDTKEGKRITSAYIMTYLIRELQWLEKRKRSHMAPYLIARALSFANALDGSDFPYPLSLFPNFEHGVIDF